jgi:predicted amidohydrolase
MRRARAAAAAAALAAAAAVLATAWWLLLAPRSVRRVGGDRLRVALCQYDSRPNAWRWNREQALRYAQEAADNGAGVIVLPEYSFCTAADTLTGLAFPKMRHAMKRFGPKLSRFCRRNRCYLFANVPWETPGGDPLDPDRRNRTLVYAPDGRVAAVYDKRNIAFLDALGLVKAGTAPAEPIDLEFGRVGTMICRDSSYPKRYRSYRDADLIVVQFAHVVDWTSSTNDPAWLNNDVGSVEEDFPRIARKIARTLRRPAVFANKTGFEPEGAFAGGSCFVAEDGEVVARAGFGGDVLYADFDLDGNGRILPSIPPVPWTPRKGR